MTDPGAKASEMTKRELFAGLALMGLLSVKVKRGEFFNGTEWADDAVWAADCLVEALNEDQGAEAAGGENLS